MQAECHSWTITTLCGTDASDEFVTSGSCGISGPNVSGESYSTQLPEFTSWQTIFLKEIEFDQKPRSEPIRRLILPTESRSWLLIVIQYITFGVETTDDVIITANRRVRGHLCDARRKLSWRLLRISTIYLTRNQIYKNYSDREIHLMVFYLLYQILKC